MKVVNFLVLLVGLYFISCSENSVSTYDCQKFIKVESQEELIAKYGYKSCNTYYTEYINGVLDESSRYMMKTDFFKTNGFVDSTFFYNDQGEYIRSSKTVYDGHGNDIGSIDYYPDGTTKTDIYWEYVYNDKDLLVELKFILNDEISDRTVYTYDSKNRILESINYDNSNNTWWKYQYNYNECDQMISAIFTNNEGQVITMYPVYDKFGNFLKAKAIENGKETVYDYNSTYNQDGRLLEFKDGEFRETYTYNSENLKSSWIQYSWGNTSQPASIYNYEYKK
jgi:hypothetical protein